LTDWTDFDSHPLAAALRRELARGMPGRQAHRTMAPELAYGRHHGPTPDDVRRAAVLLVLDPSASGWSIPAMLRPATMTAHAGQIALPGGLIESGETPTQTALRELEEELGPSATGIEILGSLSAVFVFISNFQITPFLAVSHQPLVFQPNPVEVAEVVQIGVRDLLNQTSRGSHLIRRGDLVFRAPHFAISAQRIWGATSLILAEFAELAGRLAVSKPLVRQ
jgi:8-oxo-dGTP pyrophosphatase MutT (NUDIX family)